MTSIFMNIKASDCMTLKGQYPDPENDGMMTISGFIPDSRERRFIWL